VPKVTYLWYSTSERGAPSRRGKSMAPADVSLDNTYIGTATKEHPVLVVANQQPVALVEYSGDNDQIPTATVNTTDKNKKPQKIALPKVGSSGQANVSEVTTTQSGAEKKIPHTVGVVRKAELDLKS